MYHHNLPASDTTPRVLTRRFIVRARIGDFARALDFPLDNARLAPRVRQDIGTLEVRIDIANGVTLLLNALGSHRTELVVTAAWADHKAFGLVLAAIRSPRVREQRRLPARGRQAPQVAGAATTDFAAQLARLGIGGAGVKSLVDFVDAINRSGFAIVTSKAREGAEDCVYRKPARLAQTMVDIMLRTRARTPGCCDQQLYGTLPGFRLNLSDAQRLQFRPDYVAVHEGCEYLGQLHVTLGIGQSPARCASVHWTPHAVPGLVVFTRIGEHGRCAST